MAVHFRATICRPAGSDRCVLPVRPQMPVEILRVDCGAAGALPAEPVEGTAGTPGILSLALP